MASRYRLLSKSAATLLKSSVSKPTSTFSLLPTRAGLSQSRSVTSRLGSVQSLLPLYSAISSARLISGLAMVSSSSRSLSQGMIRSANPGV